MAAAARRVAAAALVHRHGELAPGAARESSQMPQRSAESIPSVNATDDPIETHFLEAREVRGTEGDEEMDGAPRAARARPHRPRSRAARSRLRKKPAMPPLPAPRARRTATSRCFASERRGTGSRRWRTPRAGTRPTEASRIHSVSAVTLADGRLDQPSSPLIPVPRTHCLYKLPPGRRSNGSTRRGRPRSVAPSRSRATRVEAVFVLRRRPRQRRRTSTRSQRGSGNVIGRRHHADRPHRRHVVQCHQRGQEYRRLRLSRRAHSPCDNTATGDAPGAPFFVT